MFAIFEIMRAYKHKINKLVKVSHKVIGGDRETVKFHRESI